jgi:hypothetical protein
VWSSDKSLFALSYVFTALTSGVDQLHVSAAMPPPSATTGIPPPAASSSIRRKAPAPPPPVASIRASHVRNPSDPGLSRGHLRSPSDPPPIPEKIGPAKTGLAGSKLVLSTVPSTEIKSQDELYGFITCIVCDVLLICEVLKLGEH